MFVVHRGQDAQEHHKGAHTEPHRTGQHASQHGHVRPLHAASAAHGLVRLRVDRVSAIQHRRAHNRASGARLASQDKRRSASLREQADQGAQVSSGRATLVSLLHQELWAVREDHCGDVRLSSVL